MPTTPLTASVSTALDVKAMPAIHEGAARCVDDAVEAAQRGGGVHHDRAGLDRIGQVGGQRRSGSRVAHRDGIHGPARRDGNVAARRTEILGDGTAQAAATAADQHACAVEFHT